MLADFIVRTELSFNRGWLTSHLVDPVYTCEARSFIPLQHPKKEGVFSQPFFLLIIFSPLPGCVKRACLQQNTFSELVLMPLMSPEVSAVKPLLSPHLA